MTPLLLGLIGLALALPVPALLARARWPLRAPLAGIVMWQSLALAAILAMSGAGLSTALWLVSVDDPGIVRVALHVVVLGVGGVVWARFWWAAWHVWRDTQTRRRRTRALVDLLGEPSGLAPAVRILAEETPVAYCLPGRRDERVVISTGTVESLGPDDLAAVLEHERAHVRARHDLVLEGFGFLRAAFPRVLRTDAPLRQSQVMVELLADDAARRTHGAAPVARALGSGRCRAVTHGRAAPVARALVALSDSSAPTGALGAGGAATMRMRRLREPLPHPRWPAVLAASISAVVLVVPTVFLAIPWIGHAVAELT